MTYSKSQDAIKKLTLNNIESRKKVAQSGHLLWNTINTSNLVFT